VAYMNAGGKVSGVHRRISALSCSGIMSLYHAALCFKRTTAMDTDNLLHKQALLKTHKEYLQVAQLQLSNFGLTPPISLVLDIKECNAKIAQLERDIVNLQNVQLKRAGKGIYPNAEDIINIEDNNGTIKYVIHCETLDIYTLVLDSPMFDSVVKMILNCFQGKTLHVSARLGNINTSSNETIYDCSDYRKIVHVIKMQLKYLEDRNVSDVHGELTFHYNDQHIGFTIFNTYSYIYVSNPERGLAISAYNTIVAFFKSLDQHNP
jgi:hypothetical protein